MISTKTRLKLAKMIQAFAEVNSDKGVLVYEGPLDAGLEVFVYGEESKELEPAADGTYTLEDGTKIEIVEGKVVSVESPEPDNTPDPEPEPEPVDNDDQDPEPEPQGEGDEDKDAKIKELEDQLAERDAKIEELEKKIEELEGTVKEEVDKYSKAEGEINELKEQLKMSADKPAYRSLKSEVKESKAGSILSALKK